MESSSSRCRIHLQERVKKKRLPQGWTALMGPNRSHCPSHESRVTFRDTTDQLWDKCRSRGNQQFKWVPLAGDVGHARHRDKMWCPWKERQVVLQLQDKQIHQTWVSLRIWSSPPSSPGPAQGFLFPVLKCSIVVNFQICCLLSTIMNRGSCRNSGPRPVVN